MHQLESSYYLNNLPILNIIPVLHLLRILVVPAPLNLSHLAFSIYKSSTLWFVPMKIQTFSNPAIYNKSSKVYIDSSSLLSLISPFSILFLSPFSLNWRRSWSFLIVSHYGDYPPIRSSRNQVRYMEITREREKSVKLAPL